MTTTETRRLDVPAELHAQIVEWQETYGHRTIIGAFAEMVAVAMAHTAEDRAKVRKEQQSRFERFGIAPPRSGARRGAKTVDPVPGDEPVTANGH